MVMEFFKNLNWVDILVVGILIRIVYIGVQTGIVIELFKFLGALVTAFLTFHYFSILGLFLHKVTKAPLAWMNPVAFVLLWFMLFLICKVIRDGIMMLFTIEAVSSIDKWGGALIGIGRFFIVASMAMVSLLVVNDQYVTRKTVESFSAKYVFKAAPGFYTGVCEGFLTKVLPAEKPNKAFTDLVNRTGMR